MFAVKYIWYTFIDQKRVKNCRQRFCLFLTHDAFIRIVIEFFLAFIRQRRILTLNVIYIHRSCYEI